MFSYYYTLIVIISLLLPRLELIDIIYISNSCRLYCLIPKRYHTKSLLLTMYTDKVLCQYLIVGKINIL